MKEKHFHTHLLGNIADKSAIFRGRLEENKNERLLKIMILSTDVKELHIIKIGQYHRKTCDMNG